MHRGKKSKRKLFSKAAKRGGVRRMQSLGQMSTSSLLQFQSSWEFNLTLFWLNVSNPHEGRETEWQNGVTCGAQAKQMYRFSQVKIHPTSSLEMCMFTAALHIFYVYCIIKWQPSTLPIWPTNVAGVKFSLTCVHRFSRMRVCDVTCPYWLMFHFAGYHKVAKHCGVVHAHSF